MNQITLNSPIRKLGTDKLRGYHEKQYLKLHAVTLFGFLWDYDLWVDLGFRV